MSITERAERLAADLLADRERDTASRHNIVPCFSCGHTFVYRGRRDDLNGHFCSLRCQAWFDDDNPSYEDQQEQERKLLNVPLADLVIVAGPPGTVGRGSPGYGPATRNLSSEANSGRLHHPMRSLPQRLR
jgi:hypothetical protein